MTQNQDEQQFEIALSKTITDRYKPSLGERFTIFFEIMFLAIFSVIKMIFRPINLAIIALLIIVLRLLP